MYRLFTSAIRTLPRSHSSITRACISAQKLAHISYERHSSTDTGFSLRMFDPRNPSDIKALNAFLDSKIASKDEKNESLKPTFKKMAEWLKKYVRSPELMEMYADERSLEPNFPKNYR